MRQDGRLTSTTDSRNTVDKPRARASGNGEEIVHKGEAAGACWDSVIGRPHLYQDNNFQPAALQENVTNVKAAQKKTKKHIFGTVLLQFFCVREKYLCVEVDERCRWPTPRMVQYGERMQFWGAPTTETDPNFSDPRYASAALSIIIRKHRRTRSHANFCLRHWDCDSRSFVNYPRFARLIMSRCP